MATSRSQAVSQNLVKLAIPKTVEKETDVAYSPKSPKTSCMGGCFGSLGQKFSNFFKSSPQSGPAVPATTEPRSPEYRSLPRSSSME